MIKAIVAAGLAGILVTIGYAMHPMAIPQVVSIILAAIVAMLCSMPSGRTKPLLACAALAALFAIPCAITTGMAVFAVMFAAIALGIVSGVLASIVFPPADG